MPEIPTDPATPHAVPHFEERAAVYHGDAVARPEFAERFALWERTVAQWAGEAEGGVALDLGCGPGSLSWVLAKQGFRTVAVDGSSNMLELARAEAARRGQNGIEFRRRDLPLPDQDVAEFEGAASAIVMSSVVEYLPDDELMLRQCRAMLRPGGHLFMSFPNRRSPYWRLQRRLRDTRLFRDSASRHQVRQYDERDVRALAERVGLEVRQVSYFSLPLQRYLGRLWRGRGPLTATLFLTVLTPTAD